MALTRPKPSCGDSRCPASAPFIGVAADAIRPWRISAGVSVGTFCEHQAPPRPRHSARPTRCRRSSAGSATGWSASPARPGNGGIAGVDDLPGTKNDVLPPSGAVTAGF